MCIGSIPADLMVALYAIDLDLFLWLPLNGDEYDCDVNEFLLENIAIGSYWEMVKKYNGDDYGGDWVICLGRTVVNWFLLGDGKKVSRWWLRWRLGDLSGTYSSSIHSFILMNDKLGLLRRGVWEREVRKLWYLSGNMLITNSKINLIFENNHIFTMNLETEAIYVQLVINCEGLFIGTCPVYWKGHGCIVVGQRFHFVCNSSQFMQQGWFHVAKLVQKMQKQSDHGNENAREISHAKPVGKILWPLQGRQFVALTVMSHKLYGAHGWDYSIAKVRKHAEMHEMVQKLVTSHDF